MVKRMKKNINNGTITTISHDDSTDWVVQYIYLIGY